MFVASLLPLIFREDMSAAQVEQLQQDHKYDPLPEGWFFDGSVFLDYDGNRRRDRPGKFCFAGIFRKLRYYLREKRQQQLVDESSHIFSDGTIWNHRFNREKLVTV